jgi:hypothetical protein
MKIKWSDATDLVALRPLVAGVDDRALLEDLTIWGKGLDLRVIAVKKAGKPAKAAVKSLFPDTEGPYLFVARTAGNKACVLYMGVCGGLLRTPSWGLRARVKINSPVA